MTKPSVRMFANELQNSIEIVEYISGLSSESVDEDLIFEYFIGSKAILKNVATADLKISSPCHHLRNRKKEKYYEELPSETMPPLIVENGIVLDGNHRLRVALKKNRDKIYIYDIITL